MQIPEDWKGQKIYITTEGVDAHYELYVDGELVASGGDIATQATAFDERKSHEVTGFTGPGAPCHIAFRVYDRYGAGGIHHPVTIGPVQLGPGVQMLKQLVRIRIRSDIGPPRKHSAIAKVVHLLSRKDLRGGRLPWAPSSQLIREARDSVARVRV